MPREEWIMDEILEWSNFDLPYHSPFSPSSSTTLKFQSSDQFL